MRKTLSFAFLTLFWLSNAQNGWDLIRQNDFVKGRQAFLLDLEKDSLNRKSLEGLILLSETSGDELSFKKYIRRYMRHYGDENFFLLFNDDLRLKPDEILASTVLTSRAKTEALMKKADKEFYNRNFKGSTEITSRFFNDLTWSLAGPFTNLEGSGHVIAYGPETENFSSASSWKNEEGLELKWVKPGHVNKDCGIWFSDHLNSYNMNTYYANAFFEQPEDKEIYFRITRYDPIKIWVDGTLIYEADYKIRNEWDNEAVKLDIKKGTHRILVKVSSIPQNSKIGSSSNSTNGSSDSYEYSYSSAYSSVMNDYGVSRRHRGDFTLRLTDKSGTLISGLRSAEDAPAGNTKISGIAVEKNYVINQYAELSKKEPDNLFWQYLLARAYLEYDLARNGEEYFVKYYRANKSSF
ncbi:MAG: hypothetical protein IAF38_15715, partial [Bacteroidia bacterium]|nr:hypothetical protein [Bacteroidia bacterium]